jgi:ABC-2 type transport system permease protein
LHYFILELRKLLPYRTFWTLLVLHFLLLGFVATGLNNFAGNITVNEQSFNLSGLPIYQFPDVWHTITYIASFFKLILAIIIITSITNEINYRTIRQNVMFGLSRIDFLLSKMSGILFLSLLATIFVFALCLILGFTHSPDNGHEIFGRPVLFVLAYFIEVFTYLTFSLLIGFLVKRSGLAIGLLVLYSLIIEPLMIGLFIGRPANQYLPMAVIDNLIQLPFTRYLGQSVQAAPAGIDMGLSIVYALGFTGICFLLLKNRDL